MNEFAIDDAAINDSTFMYVLGEGSAAIGIATAGDLFNGLSLQGAGTVSIPTSATGSAGLMLQAAGGIGIVPTATAMKMSYFEGGAGLILDAQGDIFVRKLAEANMALQVLAAAELRLGLGLSGTAGLVITGDATGSAGLMFGGDAGVQLGADADLVKRSFLEGSGAIILDTQGIALVRRMGEGATGLDILAAADVTSWRTLEGASTITVSAQAALSAGLRMQADSFIHVDGLGDGWNRQAIRPRAVAQMNVGGEAAANLVMSGAGVADISFVLDLSGRFGGKVGIEGAAQMALVAFGQARQYQQVLIEGSAAVEIIAQAERNGVPVLPIEFVDAPPDRRLWVASEGRAFVVSPDRRQ